VEAVKHISITGPMPAAAALARKRYADACADGLHVLLDAPGDLRNNLPERRPSAADLLVTATADSGPISETTTD